MQNINFKTNFKTFCLNDDKNCVIKINTADFGILDRAEQAQAKLAELQEKAEKIQNTDGTNEPKYSVLGEIDKAIREQINYVFGADVSTPAFGTTYCFSLCDGVPMFENFINALLPVIEADCMAEAEKAKSNIGKYTKQVPQLTK